VAGGLKKNKINEKKKTLCLAKNILGKKKYMISERTPQNPTRTKNRNMVGVCKNFENKTKEKRTVSRERH
jgi:hypothetical protein